MEEKTYDIRRLVFIAIVFSFNFREDIFYVWTLKLLVCVLEYYMKCCNSLYKIILILIFLRINPLVLHRNVKKNLKNPFAL